VGADVRDAVVVFRLECYSEGDWTEGKRKMRYAVGIEKMATGYSGYVPDLTGYAGRGTEVIDG
jgi:hypothetical protein